MGKVIGLFETRDWKERKSRVYTRAQVLVPSEGPKVHEYPDPCIGREGTIVLVIRLRDGPHKGRFLYSIRFETSRGYIMQSYFEEELKFL